MKTRMNFKDEFYQKLKLLVLPIAIQNFMLALVSATDAIMLGWIELRQAGESGHPVESF